MDKRLVEKAHGLLFRYEVALNAWRADTNNEKKSKALEYIQQEIVKHLVKAFETEDPLPPIKEVKITLLDKGNGLCILTKENN